MRAGKSVLVAIGSIAVLGASPDAGAALWGYESFDSYAEGEDLVGKDGGTGWQVHADTLVNDPAIVKSSWRDAWGNHLKMTADGRAMTTAGSAATNIRGLNDTTGDESGIDDDWVIRNGEANLFVSALVTIPATAGWGGLSVFDGDNDKELVKFGFRNDGGVKLGIEQTNGTTGWTGAQAVTGGSTYLIVGKVDHENDQLLMWVNPTGAADEATPTFTRAFTNNWYISAVRIGGDGGTGNSIYFDDLRVGSTFGDVVAVPEPAALGLLGGAGLLALRRRRA